MTYWRRRCCSECGTVIDDGETKLVRGPLSMDRALRHVTWNGASIHFTKSEFSILELLVQREGKLVQGWAFFVDILNEDTDDKILDVLICKIRTKFKAVDPDFSNLHTMWGEGFIWKKLAPVEAVSMSADDALRSRLARGVSA